MAIQADNKPNKRTQELMSIIKNLTENQGYAKVEIIIRAGSIELVTISQKYKFEAQEREEPGADNLVNIIG